MQQEEFFILKKFNFSFQGIISYKQHVDWLRPRKFKCWVFNENKACNDLQRGGKRRLSLEPSQEVLKSFT
jgi:hypothetical protein